MRQPPHNPRMAAGGFTQWSLRWGPEVAVVLGAMAVADALAETFVWRVGGVAGLADWIVAAVLVFGGVALFLDRRTRAQRAVPAPG